MAIWPFGRKEELVPITIEPPPSRAPRRPANYIYDVDAYAFRCPDWHQHGYITKHDLGYLTLLCYDCQKVLVPFDGLYQRP
jgi:hypothetical protein